MLHFFPTPYPDELWYSVLCRYHVRSGNEKKATTIGELFNNKSHAAMSNFFPNNSIYDIFKQLPEGVFSFQDIIVNHTLFPYFSRIYGYDKKLEMLEKLGKGQMEVPSHVWKASKAFPELKYCPVCKEHDEHAYGEAYWHVEHQIPLICRCIKHQCELRSYKFKRRSELNESFILPGNLGDGENAGTGYCAKAYENALAKTLYDYQYLPLKVGQTKGHNNLFQELINQGYGSVSRKVDVSVDVEKLYHDLKNAFGEPFIQKIFGDHIQGAIMLRIKKWKLMSPERYAILSVFLGQSVDITFSNKPVTDDLFIKLCKLKNTGILYQKKYVADQLGIRSYQLDQLVKEKHMDPFWIKINEEKRSEMVKTYLTVEEKQLANDYIKKNNFPNLSYFIRYCVMKHIEESSN